MRNEPEIEPYYERLTSLGYVPFNYSEKHYIFSKGDRVIKIARSAYNTPQTDESYYIEKKAHDLLLGQGLPVAKIHKIHEKGELIEDFTALEEEKIEGEIFYRKNCDEVLLSQATRFMQQVARLQSTSFGFIGKDGRGGFPSWKTFLGSVIDRVEPKPRPALRAGLESVPEIARASFVLTDCNMANFIFRGGKLECVIDVERPLWGDKNFLYGMLKVRNPYMLRRVEEQYDESLVDYYAEIYKFIFRN